jgi:hypothetical protein
MKRAAILSCLFWVTSGCSSEPVPHDQTTESALGASPQSAGIAEGSREAEGVVIAANDRAVSANRWVNDAKLDSNVADAIVNARIAADSKPRWFQSVDDIDALADTDASFFVKLLAFARASGYVEGDGFEPPTQSKLLVPSNLGRPPTSEDVHVETGFDGRSPAEVETIVRGRLTNVVDPALERFVGETIRGTQKSFTIAISNLFASPSRDVQFLAGLGANEVTVLGVTSHVNRTFLVVSVSGNPAYYVRGPTGAYVSTPTPKYSTLMRARVRLGGQPGVRIFYPSWSSPRLGAYDVGITEGD